MSETQAYYSMVVVATDGGNPSKSASIHLDVYVRDANDNNPSFESVAYETRIYENLPVGTSVLRVRATDPDSGANGEVRYVYEVIHTYTIARDSAVVSVQPIVQLHFIFDNIIVCNLDAGVNDSSCR